MVAYNLFTLTPTLLPFPRTTLVTQIGSRGEVVEQTRSPTFKWFGNIIFRWIGVDFPLTFLELEFEHK